MAPSRRLLCRKLQRDMPAVGGLMVVVLLVLLVGLSAAADGGSQDDGTVVVPDALAQTCSASSEADLLNNCGKRGPKDIGSDCCKALEAADATWNPDKCVCSILKTIQSWGIDISKVCNNHGEFGVACRKQEREDREAERRQREAQRRKDYLAKLDPCPRFFEQFAAGEKTSPEDARACSQLMTCAPACQKQ